MCSVSNTQSTVSWPAKRFRPSLILWFLRRIIFRALQGLGGAGVYSLTLFSFVRIVPYKHFDKVSSLAGGISSLGLVLGPLLGGAIANNGSWRWVFLYKCVYFFYSRRMWRFFCLSRNTQCPGWCAFLDIHVLCHSISFSKCKDPQRSRHQKTTVAWHKIFLSPCGPSRIVLDSDCMLFHNCCASRRKLSVLLELTIGYFIFRDFWDILHTVCFMGVIYLSKWHGNHPNVPMAAHT